MNALKAIYKVMKDYREISGLRSYFVPDHSHINDAQERNYFCKCLKTSSRAVEHCEANERENIADALRSHKVQSYACHAGLIKWSVPVDMKNVRGVIVSEGVITKQQIVDADTWVQGLCEKYNVSKTIIKKNYNKITVMSEAEAELSVNILQQLLKLYALKIEEDNIDRGIDYMEQD